MLSEEEYQYVSTNAWVPEHLVDYVSSVSGKEPFLMGDFLCYVKGREVTLVGYPLHSPFRVEDLEVVLEETYRRFRPTIFSVLAPELPCWRGLKGQRTPQDYYLRLALEEVSPTSKVRNMLKRASREVELLEGKDLTGAHIGLVEEFVSTKDLPPRTRYLMMGIPRYVQKARGCSVLSAWTREGKLCGFAVAHMGAGQYAFYMFHITSKDWRVPGSSDLILGEIIRKAREEGKRFLNMGLGTTAGIRFFKEKWGARTFAPYVEQTWIKWHWMRAIAVISRYLEAH